MWDTSGRADDLQIAPPPAGTPGRPAPRSHTFAGPVAFWLVAVAAVAVAALTLSVSTFIRQRQTARLVQALVVEHNRRVAEGRRSSGLGELLDAVGVPGGRMIGDVLDSSSSEERKRPGRHMRP